MGQMSKLSSMTMADLMAKQTEKQTLKIERSQEVKGEVIQISGTDVILDLGSKAEGILSLKEFPDEKQDSLKVGDSVTAYVVRPENESGQVVLELHKTVLTRGGRGSNIKLDKFIAAQKNNQVLKGKGVEVNRGGLVVEIDRVRGFLPSSLVALSQAGNLEEMIDKEIQVTVVEVDPNQNRLILSQKTTISDETKAKLSRLKVGDKVTGEVAGVMSFGLFVKLEDGVEGLAHVAELSWEKVEDPASLFNVGDKIEAQIMSVDMNAGRVNLSIRQLAEDPFSDKVKDFLSDDIVKATITKVTGQGIILDVKGVEGFIPTAKLESDETYEIGKSFNCLVDSVDTQRRRINLAPFITSTKDLIYK